MKKKIIIILIILFLLGGYYILNLSNIEDNKGSGELSLEDFNVEVNEAKAKDGTITLEIKDTLEDYILTNADNDIIELSKDQYIDLALKDPTNYGKVIFFYNENKEVVFAGTLKNKDGRYFLEKATFDEMYDNVEYKANTEIDRTNNTKIRGLNNVFASKTPSFQLQTKFTTGFSKNFIDENYIKGKIEHLSVVNVKVEVSEIEANIRMNPLTNTYYFSVGFDYNLDFNYKDLVDINVKSCKNKVEEIENNIETSEKVKNAIKLSNFNSNIKWSESLSSSVDYEKNVEWKIRKSNENNKKFEFSGLDERLLEKQIGFIELPPMMLGCGEQILNQLVVIPIVLYIDMSGEAKLELSNEFQFNTTGKFESSFDNKRKEQFQTINNEYSKNCIVNNGISGDATFNLKAGVAIQLYACGIKSIEVNDGKIEKVIIGGLPIIEGTLYIECGVLLSATAMFSVDLVNNNQLFYFKGALSFDVSLKFDGSYALAIKTPFVDFEKNVTINILTYNIIKKEFSSIDEENNIGTVIAFHDCSKVNPEEYKKYNINVNGLIGKLPLTEMSKLEYENAFKIASLKQSYIDAITSKIDYQSKKIIVDANIHKPLNTTIKSIVVDINGKNIFVNSDNIELNDNKICINLDLEFTSQSIDLKIVNFTIVDDNIVETIEVNLSSNLQIDLSNIKISDYYILTPGIYYEGQEIEIAIDLDNILNLNVENIEISIGSDRYFVNKEEFISNNDGRIIVKVKLNNINCENMNKNISIDNITFKLFEIIHYDSMKKNLSINIVSLGDGTVSNPYKLFTTNDFGKLNCSNQSHAIMMNDIDFYKINSWKGIDSFNSTFDGNNYRIKNLRLNNIENVSIFGNIYKDGVVRNVTFDSCVSFSDNMSSIVCGENNGLIQNVNLHNCSSKSNFYASLLCSINRKIIKDCSVYNGYIESIYNYSGQIAGKNLSNALISNCKIYNSKIIGKNNLGLCCGLNNGKVKNIVVKDSIIIGDKYIGGIVGYNERISDIASIEAVQFYGELIGNSYGGGIVGYLDSGTLVNYDVLNNTSIIFKNYYGNIYGDYGSGVIIK